MEAEATRYTEIPDDEIKVEVKVNGRWVEVGAGKLT